MADRSHEPVALSHHRLQEARLLGVVAQRLTDLADGSVDALFSVHEYVFAPQPSDDLFSRDQLATPS